MNNDCPHCLDHENRIVRLEKNMEELRADNKKQSVTVAMISLIGAVVTSMMSFAGVVFTAFLKSKGVI